MVVVREDGLPARSTTLMLKDALPSVDDTSTVVEAVHDSGPPVGVTTTPSRVTDGVVKAGSLMLNVSTMALPIVASV